MCKHVCNMAKTIQLRHVPDALHRTLKSRAAMAGMSLSDYLISEIEQIAERPSLAEFRTRLHSRKRVHAELNAVRLVRKRARRAFHTQLNSSSRRSAQIEVTQ